MATTAILTESLALSQHQLPISNLQYYSNSTSDSPSSISAVLSSESALTLSHQPSSQGPPSSIMAYSLVQSPWHNRNNDGAHSSSPSIPASSYRPLDSKHSAIPIPAASQTSPESNQLDSSGQPSAEDHSSEHAQWAKECIARLLTDVSSLEFQPRTLEANSREHETDKAAIHMTRSVSENLLVPDRSALLDRRPSRRIDRTRSYKQPGIATISEENHHGTSCSNSQKSQTKPQEPRRLIRRLSLLAQPLKRSLSLISDRGGSMESVNISQENERRTLSSPQKESRLHQLPQTPRLNRPMSMAVPLTDSSLLEQPAPRRTRAHRMSSIELMQYLSSNLLNVEQDLHHERLETFQSPTNSSNVTTIDDNASSSNSEADSPDTVLSGVEFPISAFAESNAKPKPKATKQQQQESFIPHTRKRSLKRSISSIDILAFSKVFRSNSISQEEILRSSTYGGTGGAKSSTKSVSKREMQSIIAWKNTTRQLKSEDSVQLLPPLSYQSEAQRIRNQQIRRFIIQEIYTTEQTYLDHLNIIKTMFMDPFIAAATQTSRPLVNPNDISTIFAYIPNIIQVSNILAYRFESVAKSWHEQSSLVGAVFLQMENEFEVYIRYAVNFHLSQRCINRAHNNILYRRFIQESLRKKETNRMGLSDYMIIPIQRVTRYSLLLKDLKKHTPSTHPDYDNINMALKTMTGLALAMNDAQKKS